MENGCSRMSTISCIEEAIKVREGQIERLKALKEYVTINPMPLPVDEIIWGMVTNARGSYYI